METRRRFSNRLHTGIRDAAARLTHRLPQQAPPFICYGALCFIALLILTTTQTNTKAMPNPTPLQHIKHALMIVSRDANAGLDAQSIRSRERRFAERANIIFKEPNTCVYNCSAIAPQNFVLPRAQRCRPSQTCSFIGLWPFHYRKNTYIRRSVSSTSGCRTKHVATCTHPWPHDCKEHGWREWTVHHHQRNFTETRTIYSVQFLPSRPFSIKSIFPTQDTRYIKVIAYFLPNKIAKNRCNQLYCFYEYANGEVERAEARPGDMSFTYCPAPSHPQPDVVLRLTYDHQIFSEPVYYLLDTPASSLPPVYMTICAMVRDEGPYLREWIEFHTMMGYQRFILYDNNAANGTDAEMESILQQYKSSVIRFPWPYAHAQTEAATDCITRFGETTEWMTFVDVDEFVVPGPKYSTINEILQRIPIHHSILQATWLVFGPCKSQAVNTLLDIELCRQTYPYHFPLPKPTFRPRDVAGVQAYGPHFPRLTRDLSVRTRSDYLLVNEYFKTYHYRYRTKEEFFVRRSGNTADRIMKRNAQSLLNDWNKGERLSSPLADNENDILRFVPELRRRLALK
eukprot:TRINITY_DN5963_c0_g1_i1.p1 TRINITY_DN5963_c0_g1~~TRINITY_DN5963_c0_g1_i1.p1  ORF type:complete len:569 (+),score=84.49 TRINITY_DN5963_c0_g1_i1:85-1791(+)